MTEPVQTTMEEASRCPRCEQPGDYRGERALSGRGEDVTRGATIKTFMCMNKRCRWFETTWTVQVNPNGTIPPASLDRPKRYHPLPDDGGQTVAALERQIELETQAGGAQLNKPGY